MSRQPQGTQLIWAAPLEHFIFIDPISNTETCYAASGSVKASREST